MRWDELFGDLDAQWHAASQEALEHEINERARVDGVLVPWGEVLRGGVGQSVSLLLRHGAVHRGRLARVEAEWVLLTQDGRQLIVVLAAVVRVQGLSGRRAAPAGRIPFTLPSALRLLARNRSVVMIELDSALATTVRGVIDAVGADFLLLTQLADGQQRAAENQQGLAVVPLHGVAALSTSVDNEF